jgi:hypothetical protein
VATATASASASGTGCGTALPPWTAPVDWTAMCVGAAARAVCSLQWVLLVATPAAQVASPVDAAPLTACGAPAHDAAAALRARHTTPRHNTRHNNHIAHDDAVAVSAWSYRSHPRRQGAASGTAVEAARRVRTAGPTQPRHRPSSTACHCCTDQAGSRMLRAQWAPFARALASGAALRVFHLK